MTGFLRGAREVGPVQTRDSQLTGKMFCAVKSSTAEQMGHGTAAAWRRLSLDFVKGSFTQESKSPDLLAHVLGPVPWFSRRLSQSLQSFLRDSGAPVVNGNGLTQMTARYRIGNRGRNWTDYLQSRARSHTNLCSSWCDVTYPHMTWSGVGGKVIKVFFQY